MKRLSLFAIASMLAPGCVGVHTLRSGVTEAPLSWCLVREMDPIPEMWWPPCQGDAYPDDVARALTDWEKKRPWVQQRLTPSLVRSLSRWAHREMETYDSVPQLTGVKLCPVACKAKGDHNKWILLEGTVDTLPSHSPGIVTRWLKIFLVYDSEIWSVVRATVTIRGARY